MKLFRKNRITRFSIKEGFDNLPSGLCFADPNGIIILCNRRMHELAQIFLGADLQHIFELRKALETPASSIFRISPMTYRLPDGTIVQFSEETLSAKDRTTFFQVMAIDITTLYETEHQLELENKLLMETNARAVKLYEELDKIVRDEENFAIKTRVHDEIGMALMHTRRLLTESGSLAEMHTLAQDWGRIAATLGAAESEEEIPEAVSEFTRLTEMLPGIGIRLKVQGDSPEDAGIANVISLSIRECAINAVRHAEGTELVVRIVPTPTILQVLITNNGQAPTGDIREGGGLSALRNRVEMAGGSMHIESSPAFCLELSFPRKEAVK